MLFFHPALVFFQADLAVLNFIEIFFGLFAPGMELILRDRFAAQTCLIFLIGFGVQIARLVGGKQSVKNTLGTNLKAGQILTGQNPLTVINIGTVRQKITAAVLTPFDYDLIFR